MASVAARYLKFPQTHAESKGALLMLTPVIKEREMASLAIDVICYAQLNLMYPTRHISAICYLHAFASIFDGTRFAISSFNHLLRRRDLLLAVHFARSRRFIEAHGLATLKQRRRYQFTAS